MSFHYPVSWTWNPVPEYPFPSSLPVGFTPQDDGLLIYWPDDPESTPAALSERSFQWIDLYGCLEYAFRPEVVLAWWWRRVKQGGWLEVTVPDADAEDRDTPEGCEERKPLWGFSMYRVREGSRRTLSLMDLERALPDCRIDRISRRGCAPTSGPAPYPRRGGYLAMNLIKLEREYSGEPRAQRR